MLEEEFTSENNIHELQIVINDLGYRNRKDVNSLLGYSGVNDTCLKVQSLEEIVASVLNIDENQKMMLHDL